MRNPWPTPTSGDTRSKATRERWHQTEKENNMPTTQIEHGTYLVEITNQNFTENKEGKPGFVIFFKLLARIEESETGEKSETPVDPLKRDITLWIDNDTKGRVWRHLDELGFTGKSFYQLRPEVKGFYDLRGKRIELEYTQRQGKNQYEGRTFDNWDFPPSKPKLTNPQRLRCFDRDGGASGSDEEAVPTGGITDDDVPF
jgi:hypothetical protein